MNQNYTICVRAAKIYFVVCCRILVIILCVPWDEKSWKLLLYGMRGALRTLRIFKNVGHILLNFFDDGLTCENAVTMCSFVLVLSMKVVLSTYNMLIKF